MKVKLSNISNFIEAGAVQSSVLMFGPDLLPQCSIQHFSSFRTFCLYFFSFFTILTVQQLNRVSAEACLMTEAAVPLQAAGGRCLRRLDWCQANPDSV